MGLVVIRRVQCDTCHMEEPEKYWTIPTDDKDNSPFIICYSCVRLLGQVDANAVFSMAVAVGKYEAQVEKRCPNCREIVTENQVIPFRELLRHTGRFQPPLKS